MSFPASKPLLPRPAGRLGPVVLAIVFVAVGCATGRPPAPGAAPSTSGPASTGADAPSDTVRAEPLDGEETAAVEETPADSVARARRLYGEGRYGAIVDLLGPAACTDTAAAGANYWLGRAHQARRRHGKAVSVLECARRARPAPRVLLALGRSHDALYNLEDAEAAYRAYLRSDGVGDAVNVRWALADIYRRQQSWANARRQYESVLEALPEADAVRVHAPLGRCYQALGNTARAIRHFEAAHQAQPARSTVALRLAGLYEARGEMDRAETVLKRSRARRPQDPRLWRRTGRLAIRRDRMNEAATAYRRALGRGDSSAVVYQNLGIARVGSGQPADAVSALRAAERKGAKGPATAFYLGVAYRDLDSLDRARHYLETAVDRGTDGRVLDAFVQLASVHDRTGRLPAAVDAYKTALRLQPERTELHFYLATLYDEHYRDKTVAARHYRRYLEETAAPDSAKLSAYALRRLRALRPSLHFQEGRQASRRADTAATDPRDRER